MKCLACPATNADAITVEVAVADTLDTADLEWAGYTEYPGDGVVIGTSCPTCDRDTLLADWRTRAIDHIAGRPVTVHPLPTARTP